MPLGLSFHYSSHSNLPLLNFLRYNSSQEGLLTILSPHTPTFSSINYTCHHHSCCHSTIPVCFHVRFSTWTINSMVLFIFLVIYTILFPDVIHSWHLLKCWLADSLNVWMNLLYLSKDARNSRMLDRNWHGAGRYQSLLWLGSTAQ